jgi:hypothetical protein
MGSKGWIKRVLPFVATFAVGIFIAGLFGFGGPRFGRHERWRMRVETQRLRIENEDLRNENLRLRNGCHGMDLDMNVPDIDAVPGPPAAIDGYLPPPPPVRMPHRPPRHDR